MTYNNYIITVEHGIWVARANGRVIKAESKDALFEILDGRVA
jgi:hypothetical protein